MNHAEQQQKPDGFRKNFLISSTIRYSPKNIVILVMNIHAFFIFMTEQMTEQTIYCNARG